MLAIEWLTTIQVAINSTDNNNSNRATAAITGTLHQYRRQTTTDKVSLFHSRALYLVSLPSYRHAQESSAVYIKKTVCKLLRLRRILQEIVNG